MTANVVTTDTNNPMLEQEADFERYLDLIDKWHNDEYEDIISGKSVAIIGGGPDIDESAYDRDIVVRLNCHMPDQGGRTDIIYWNNTKIGLRRRQALTASIPDLKFIWINIPAPEAPDLAYWCEKRDVPWGFWGVNDFMRYNDILPEIWWPFEIMEKYDFNPLTGSSAIHHLLKHDIKELFITGLDYYVSYTPNGMPPQWIGIHEILPQMKFLIDKMEEDDRVLVDSTLEEILPKYYEFCGRIKEMGTIIDPVHRDVLFPGHRVELWTPQRMFKIIYEIHQTSPKLFNEICGMVGLLQRGINPYDYARAKHQGKLADLASTAGATT